MASECSPEALLGFLRANGGRVKHADLVEHFAVSFPEEPEQRAAARRDFKLHVDDVAFVKTESDVKYVCLKKRFRVPEKEQLNGTRAVHQEGLHHRDPAGSRSRDAAELRPRAAPGSGYGSDCQVRVPHAAISGADGLEMGNRGSFKREKRESKKRVQIPDIAVITASPLPAEGSMFNLPGPVQTGSTGQVDAGGVGLHPTDRPVESLSPEGPNELERTDVVFRNSKGSRRGVPSRPPESDEDGGQSDRSLSGSEGLGSPKSSRKHFIQAMMSSSPQLRRSMAVRSSVYLTSGNDGDSASLASSNPDDDRTSVALDPLEHEWMMCSSDGEWGNLYPLLAADPSLVLRKDFVTGFTCLHWAAKQGKPELMALLINFAKQHDVLVGVDVRSNTGYTPLHVAAMHNHMEVVKLLVGAYSADVEVRDYSGRKACQYLTDNVSVDIRDIIGAYERSDSKNADRGGGGRWRFSKALQSNLKPLRLLNPNDCDAVDGEARPRAKVLRRKSSLSRMKPKLQRLRLRTSQIVHSTTFRESEEGSGSGSFKSRPKTHFFG